MEKKLLVVVDYQKDFVDGALGFEGAPALEAGILKAAEECLEGSGYVIFTRDTHAENYLETREGRHLPISHCIAGSEGHSLYGGLRRYETEPQPNTLLLDKPTFGSPDIARKAELLCKGAPEVVELCGVVTDICVIANAILLHTAFPDARVRILRGLCGSGNEEQAGHALAVLAGMGMEMA